MNTLPPGEYDTILHFLRRHDRNYMLDFSEMGGGYRYTCLIWPNHVQQLGIALLGQNASLRQVAGGQVVITVDVKELSAGRFVNRVLRITRPRNIRPVESSIPTELPIMTFEEVFSEQEQSKEAAP